MKDLTKVERLEIAILLKKAYSKREIARVLGRSPNTLSYEVKINSVQGVYDPYKAHLKAQTRKKNRRFQYSKIEKPKFHPQLGHSNLLILARPSASASYALLNPRITLGFLFILSLIQSRYS